MPEESFVALQLMSWWRAVGPFYLHLGKTSQGDVNSFSGGSGTELVFVLPYTLAVLVADCWGTSSGKVSEQQSCGLKMCSKSC